MLAPHSAARHGLAMSASENDQFAHARSAGAPASAQAGALRLIVLGALVLATARRRQRG